MSSSITASSVSSSAPTESSSPGQAVEPSGPPPLLSSQASLYLYTFLVTLVLLLSVSGAIVIRSLFLRRRHRLLVEEAIRNGTYVPPSVRAKRLLGQKPVIHDAYVDLDDSNAEGKSRMLEIGVARWWDIRPVSVMILKPDKSPYFGTENGVTEQAVPANLPVRAPSLWRSMFSFLSLPQFMNRSPGSQQGSRGSAAAPSASDAFCSTNQKTDNNLQAPHYARVSVIVAMPRPPSHHAPQTGPRSLTTSCTHSGLDSQPHLPPHDETPEETLPHLELGISDTLLSGWEESDLRDLVDRVSR